MPPISVGDLLVGSAAWSQSQGLSLAITHGQDGWTAAFTDSDGRTVAKAERPHLRDALMELYTAGQTARAVPA